MLSLAGQAANMGLWQVWTARNIRNPNDFQWVPQRIQRPQLEASRTLVFGRQLQTLEMLVFPRICKGFQ